MSAKIVQYSLQAQQPSHLASFYRDTLGMKVLRHEEYFDYCMGTKYEGIYIQAWTKTVFGYFPEHKSFTLEVHCCAATGPPLKEYQLVGFTINSREILKRARVLDEAIMIKNNKFIVQDSDGRQFFVMKKKNKPKKEPFVKITLRSTNLKKTLDFWHCHLGMLIFSKKRRSIVVGYSQKGIKLKFILATKQIYRGKDYLKIAAPLSYIQKLGEATKLSNYVITMPLTHFHVNNLVDVNFMLLSDPDAHLICFIDDMGFEKMAVANPRANLLLNSYVGRQDRMKILENLSEENFNLILQQKESDLSFPCQPIEPQ